jgi:hypothetical protein
MQPGARPAPCYVIHVSARLPRILAAVSVALVLVHVAIQTYHYRWHEVPTLLKDMFDVDEEQNVPTWFSGAILWLSSALVLAIADTRRRQGRRNVVHWYGLAIGFAFLSFDEIAGLHETLNSIIVMTWAIPGAIAVGIVGLAYVPFLIGLRARTRWLFVVAGAIYVGGAVGMELLTDHFYLVKYTPDTLAYNLQTAVEEGMEMLGVVLFIHALLDYMRAEEGVPVTIALEPGG